MAKTKRGPVKEQAAQDFEKLGVFYLGRGYDLGAKKSQGGLLLYDSKDLVTHAVCVGMTGSGKTGLCIGLLEEAAIDSIPALIIDPKGDLANLMLTFPQLRAEDFAPWVNGDDARKKGLSPGDYAKQQAELWKTGLAGWRQNEDRITRLQEAAEIAIYTPGSNAGIPVSILKSFEMPDKTVREDAELLRERIGITATSLLGLIGVDADPMKSREHILLSTILNAAWSKGANVDLAALIQQIQEPPVSKVGMLDLDLFYPSKDRFALAMKLNNLLAAPGFSVWLEGAPLDIQSLLYTPKGKPRLAILSIAHLNDAERMFFVSLLLNQVLGWMRSQSGTTSLRAILYMDEIFGYFPPVANPPSKQPLLTLLKQARAFGVGVVLATQNPVDLDYKGLANTGTWFIGRLQTERDKARVIAGLEGAAAGAGKKFDKGRMEQILAGLGNRVFLMNNVHDDAPVIFETRWTLSYLRGPLTRMQIKTLMEPVKRLGYGGRELEGHQQSESARTPSPSIPQSLGSRPILPPDVPQYFVPVRGKLSGPVVYQPMLLGAAQVHVSDAKAGVDVTQNVVVATPFTDNAVSVDWDAATDVDVAVADLEKTPAEPAQFGVLPPAAGKAKNFEAWSKDFLGWLYRTQTIELLKSPGLKKLSRPSESERDFRARLQQAGREERDRIAQKLRDKFAPKIAGLQERKRRALQVVERESEQAMHSQIQTAISIGATLLEAFTGRKAIKTSTIGKATTAVRGAGRAMKDRKDVDRAEDNVAAIDQQIAELETQFKAETDTLASAVDPLTEKLETVSLKPSKSTISVRLVALAWVPS